MSRRPDTLPWEDMYLGLPYPYLTPSQSKYHNLGFNGFLPKSGMPYPDKDFGRNGDYGPRQVNDMQYPAIYPYPLDNRPCLDKK